MNHNTHLIYVIILRLFITASSCFSWNTMRRWRWILYMKSAQIVCGNVVALPVCKTEQGTAMHKSTGKPWRKWKHPWLSICSRQPGGQRILEKRQREKYIIQAKKASKNNPQIDTVLTTCSSPFPVQTCCSACRSKCRCPQAPLCLDMEALLYHSSPLSYFFGCSWAGVFAYEPLYMSR